MYTPIPTIFGSIVPATGADLTLHTFLGISWHILLPYTLFGIALMVYSQNRLFRGQRALKREGTLAVAPKTSK